jgi:hypothetical protein
MPSFHVLLSPPPPNTAAAIFNRRPMPPPMDYFPGHSFFQTRCATFDGQLLDIQPPGTNLYFKYEFVLATPAIAVGETRQST